MIHLRLGEVVSQSDGLALEKLRTLSMLWFYLFSMQIYGLNSWPSDPQAMLLTPTL